MQKENEKLAKKLKAKEISRIVNLVTRAMQHDPRILADKEAKKLAKEAKVREREQEKLAKEMEEKKVIEQIEVSNANAKVNKAEKEKQRKLDSKIRNTCKKVLKAFNQRCQLLPNNPSPVSDYGCFSFDEIETVLFTGCAPADINTNINEVLGGEAATKEGSTFINELNDETCESILSAIRKEIEMCKSKPKTTTSGSGNTGNNGTAATGQNRVWTRDELSALSKCVKKFPAGTTNRWSTIATEMNTLMKANKSKTVYTMEECLKAANNTVKMMGK